MAEEISSEDTIIRIAGSKKHTLNALAYALATDSKLVVENPYLYIDTDYYNNLIDQHPFQIKYDMGMLVILKQSENADVPPPPIMFDIDNPVGLLLATKFGEKISFAIENTEDFERKILILRRMGTKFGDEDKLAHVYPVQNFHPVKIKFNFQESNYYLAEYVACMTALSGLDTEFLSKINVVSNLQQELFPFTLDIENLKKKKDETNELEKRLQKLKKARRDVRYHYRVKRSDNENSGSIKLPADSYVAAMAAVLTLLTRKDNVKIGPLGQFENEKTFVSILTKLGVKASIIKIDSEYFYSIEADKLIGRKIDENQMRAFPEAFGPLAILASFANDKTILRGLATSSSLWHSRISGVASILTSAGVRVGEIEDGFVIEPPKEFTDIEYNEFKDPYLQLVQLAAAIVINSKPLTSEYFSANKHYPHFHTCLDKIRPKAKSLAR